MELTDDMLRRMANVIVDLWSRSRVLEITLIEQFGVDPHHLEQQLAEARQSPESQSWRDQVFEQLKGDV